ncbi:MAG: hypothetical protein HC860_18705 [Alkalinema sp. RU_4_3]|nr:hypothetical protein [Alkalinema sp. RU_4_3]
MIDGTLQDDILKTLHGLPPGRMLLQRQTLAQKNAWADTKRRYLWLHHSFQDFFEGRGRTDRSPIPEEMGLMRDLYLKFYQVIQWGWGHIKAEFDLLDLQLPSDSAGNALLQILELECLGQLAPFYTAYYRFSANEHRDLATLDRKLTQALTIGEPTTELQKRYRKKLKPSLDLYGEYIAYQMLLIGICEDIPKKDDPQLAKYVMEYGVARSNLDRWLQTQLHQRNGPNIVEYPRGI